MDQIAALLERSEAEAVFGYVDAAPPAVKESLGIATARIGDGVVLSVRNDVTNYWSKTLGFGFDQPVTAELVAEITSFYREEGTKVATLQFAPSVLPANWEEICQAEGITQGGTWLKLARLAGLVVSGETKLKIGVVQPADVDEWSSVLLRGFSMPEAGLAQMAAGLVGRPGWTMYAAWDGDRIVASASLLIKG